MSPARLMGTPRSRRKARSTQPAELAGGHQLGPSLPALGRARSIAPTMAHTIAVLSQKGGTGKTTAVRTLTDAFRRSGLDTLAVDLDPQGNLSDYFDVDPQADPTVADVLTGRAEASEAVHQHVIPAT